MNKKIAIIIIMSIFICGCVSQQGRLSILDLDFRKAPQIEAAARESEAPYKDWTIQTQQEKQNEVKKESISITWWETLFNMISKLECRFTLFQIEWADHRKTADKVQKIDK